jgi:hypothetical protein
MTAPTDQFTPSTIDVAGYIKNRTVDGNNHYLGDFTSETVVTDTEVQGLIALAEPLVLSALQWNPLVPNIVGFNVDATKALIALLTAIFVEITKFSEQIARGVSPYTPLNEMYTALLAAKQAELGIQSATESGLSLWDLVARQSGVAQYDFPDDPMVNWNTAL